MITMSSGPTLARSIAAFRSSSSANLRVALARPVMAWFSYRLDHGTKLGDLGAALLDLGSPR
jgi:hypothetical protein